MGLAPKSLYPNRSPDVRGLSSSEGRCGRISGSWGREPWPQPGALLGLLGMREAALIWVPSRFSGKANAPPPLFPQVIISGSLWNQPIQAEAVWLQTGAPGEPGMNWRLQTWRAHDPRTGWRRPGCGCRARVPVCVCKHTCCPHPHPTPLALSQPTSKGFDLWGLGALLF